MTATPTTSSIDVNRIVRDADLQIRQEFDAETVAEYIAHVDELPPVTVFFDGERYWLADGWHRLDAHQGAGRTHINCKIHEGGKLDALKHALGANRTHGLKRKPQDIRKAVRVAMLTADLQANSSVLVSQLVGISQKHAHNIMVEIRKELGIAPPEEVVTRTGGTCAVPKRPTDEAESLPMPRPAKADAAPQPTKTATPNQPEQAATQEVQALPPPAATTAPDAGLTEREELIPDFAPNPHAYQPPIMDGCKVPITDPYLIDVFETTREFERKFKVVYEAFVEILHDMCEHEAGFFLSRMSLAKDSSGTWKYPHLESLKGAAPTNLPFIAYCPSCEYRRDKGCKTCAGRGWLTMHQFSILDDQMKAKINNRRKRK
jgi:uncharacterized ParB-like nuclease family protein